MQIIKTRAELRAWTLFHKEDGQNIAFAPTMGALHEGHLSLVRMGRELATRTLVSIFVNPTQFGPGEDFDKYPRTEEADAKLLKAAGVDAVYMPPATEIYPDGFATTVSVKDIGQQLCGAARPGHFDGVATVVSKLLLQAMPDVAIFGEKDYQQLHIIRRVVSDLDIPVRVIGAPIVREADGLAMSSRNRYLSKEERAIAPALHATLQETARALKTSKDIAKTLEEKKLALLMAGFKKLDYLELRDAATLAPVQKPGGPARLLAAAHLGTTRLIDNIAV